MTLASILKSFNRIVSKLEKLKARRLAEAAGLSAEEQSAQDLLEALRERRRSKLTEAEQIEAVRQRITALIA